MYASLTDSVFNVIAPAKSVNRAVNKSSTERWRFLCQDVEPDPHPADSSCLPNHDSLRAASGLVTLQVPILTAKPQLPIVCLSQKHLLHTLNVYTACSVKDF